MPSPRDDDETLVGTGLRLAPQPSSLRARPGRRRLDLRCLIPVSATKVERPRATSGERRREQLTTGPIGRRTGHHFPAALAGAAAVAAAGNAAHDLTATSAPWCAATCALVLRLPPTTAGATRRAAGLPATTELPRRVMRLDTRRLAGQRLVDIDNSSSSTSADGRARRALCTVHCRYSLIAPPCTIGHDCTGADDTTYLRLYEHLNALRARQDGAHRLAHLRGSSSPQRGRTSLFCTCYRDGDVPVEFLVEPTTFPAVLPPCRPVRSAAAVACTGSERSFRIAPCR